MELSNLSKSLVRVQGRSIPAVGFGTYKLTGASGVEAIKHAIKTGYRLLDTAHVYKNEKEVGQAVRECIKEGILKERNEIFITSKLHSGYHNPKLVLKVLEHQLSLLDVGYLDLYLIHAPWGHKPKSAEFDLETESDKDGNVILDDFDHLDIWRELEKAVDLGLVKNIGVSNFDSAQVDYILSQCRIRPINNQIEIHPYLDQSELIEHHRKLDISVTSFMSLGRGDRTKDENDVNLFEHSVIKNVALKYGKSTAQVLLRYQIQLGNLIIPKSATPSRIEENSKLFDFELSESDLSEIRKLDLNQRSCMFAPSVKSKNFPKSWTSEKWYQKLDQ